MKTLPSSVFHTEDSDGKKEKNKQKKQNKKLEENIPSTND